jgi:transcriptional regulator with XRE-family HTH domain
MVKGDIYSKLGSKLKEIREKNKLTQAEVAKNADMTVTYYAMVERGEVNPSLEKLFKISKALGVKLTDIIPNA